MSTRSFLIFYLAAGIWTTRVCSTIIQTYKENSVKLADDGSECRNVVYQLQNSSNDSVSEQLQRLFKKIEAMEKGIDGKLEKLEALENITLRELGKMEALEKRLEDTLGKIAQRMTTGTNGSCFCNGKCPVGYDYYKEDKFCYKLHKVCKSWSEARDACRQEGGDLISLKNSNLEIFSEIARLHAGGCANSYVWVGATNIGSVGKWFWLNGENIDSVLWAPGEPNGGPVHCVHVNYFRNKLNDYGCSLASNFLCQINMTR